MDLTLQQKIKIACEHANITPTEMGRRVGMSQVSTSKRIKTGKFTQEEMEIIAKAIGAEWFSGFRFPDGTEVK